MFVLTLAVLAVLAVVAGAVWLLVLKDDSKTPVDLLNEALAAHVQGDFPKATELYQKILVEDPTNKFAHYNLGLIAQTQGRLDDAETSYRQALSTDPQYTPALFNLAIIRFDAKDYVESIDLYQRLIAFTPDDAKGHLNLGYALRAAGQRAAGDQEIAKAIQLDPSLAANAPPTTVPGQSGTTPDESSQDSTTTTAG